MKNIERTVHRAALLLLLILYISILRTEASPQSTANGWEYKATSSRFLTQRASDIQLEAELWKEVLKQGWEPINLDGDFILMRRRKR